MPDDILKMLQRVERIFAQEVARVDLDSHILNNMVADKRAEAKFHSLMGVIERLNAKKKAKLEKTENTHNNGSENQEKEVAEEADDLITFKEFVDALEFLRGPKDASSDLDSKDLRNFDLRILPRTLSFREVLGSKKYETAY